MAAKLLKSFSTLIAFLLVLTSLSVPIAQAASASANQAQTTQAVQAAHSTMPDGLLQAVLETTSQPFEASAEGYRASSGGLDFMLNISGLQADGDGLTWGLALTGFGRGEQVAAVSEAEIAPIGNRLEYRRHALTEWYRNTALGLEQGFTILQSPPGAGSLVLQLDLSTDLAGTPDADGRGASFAAPGGQTLRYDHLRAWDADGAPLEATLLSTPVQVLLQVNDREATYPITIDPIIYIEQKVTATGAMQDAFGYSVALSGDSAIVGAAYDDVGANIDQGSAYIFLRIGTTWILQQQLTASDGEAHDRFGYSVALSGDTALVGSAHDDLAYNNQGSAYVFTRSGAAWTQQGQLTASDGFTEDYFGSSVALSGDTAVVGAYYDDVGSNPQQGSAYVFVRSGTTWTQQAQLTASDGASGDVFGVSIALSGDTVLVGACWDDVGTNADQGSAYVFTRSGATWTQQGQLTASDGAANDWFGWSVALSGDTALLGAPNDDVGANIDQGSAYVFTRSGTTWTQQGQLSASDGAAYDYFGYSVSISVDTALVGAYVDDVSASNQGSAYVFTRSLTTWTQEGKLIASDGEKDDYFGCSVALSGETALIGGTGDSVGAIGQGSAYAFVRSGISWSLQGKLTASVSAANDNFGWSVALSGDTALVGALNENIGSNAQQGSVYVFVRSGTIWNQMQKLTAPDGAAGDSFGNSVALSGDTALVGAFNDDGAQANQGSVYIFTRNPLYSANWYEQQKLTASDGAADDNFGYSVALSGDTALIGAYWDDVVSSDQGSAYVFTRSGTTWTQQQKLTASDGAASDLFGASVALSGDTALVGALGDDIGAKANQGSAYVFTRSGTTWTQQSKLTASDGAADDYFGRSVALSGETALVGAYFADLPSLANPGAAYVFTRSGTTWSQQAKLTASDANVNDNFGISVALSGNTALVGSYLDDDGGITNNQGSAYVFMRSGTTWTQQQKLTAADGASGDWYGISVALSDDKALVGASMDDVGAVANQGSAYFYQFDYPPTVVSITRASANPTNASSVDFTVAFSEAVFGVDTADFSLTKTGTLSGEAVTGVNGSGASYTITVSTGSGAGTLRLDIPNTTIITDMIGNPLSGMPYTGGQSYDVDRAAPSIVSITRLDPNPTSASSVRFTVTFSEAVTGVQSSDFSLTTTGSLSSVAVTGVSGSGSSYTITVSTGTGDGALRLDIPNTATINDLLNNPLSGLPYTNGEEYTVMIKIYLPLVLKTP